MYAGYVSDSWKHLGLRVVALVSGLGSIRLTVEDSSETSKHWGFPMRVCLYVTAYVCLWMYARVCVHICVCAGAFCAFLRCGTRDF